MIIKYGSAEHERRMSRAYAYWDTITSGCESASAWDRVDTVAREYARGDIDMRTTKRYMRECAGI